MKQKQIADCSEPLHPSPVSVSICVCIIRFYIIQMNVMYTTSTCINTTEWLDVSDKCDSFSFKTLSINFVDC